MSVCSTACGNAFIYRYHRWQCTTVWEPLIWIFFFFFNSPAVVREAHLGVILVRLRCANNGLCGPWTRSTVSSWCMETQICPVCWMISDQGSHSDVTLDLLYFYFYFSTVTYRLVTPSFHLSAQSGSRRLTSQRSTVWEKRTYESAPPTTSQGFQLLR